MAVSLFSRSFVPIRPDDQFVPIEPLEPRSLLSTVFGPTPVSSASPQVVAEVMADFDGDGVNDLAGIDINSPNRIVFLKGRGDGSFDAPLRTTLNVRATSIGAESCLHHTPGMSESASESRGFTPGL